MVRLIQALKVWEQFSDKILAVGSYGMKAYPNAKAEYYDIDEKNWTDIQEYPYTGSDSSKSWYYIQYIQWGWNSPGNSHIVRGIPTLSVEFLFGQFQLHCSFLTYFLSKLLSFHEDSPFIWKMVVSFSSIYMAGSFYIIGGEKCVDCRGGELRHIARLDEKNWSWSIGRFNFLYKRIYL